MNLTNPKTLDQLRNLLAKLKDLDYTNALEVAMGEAHVTKEILLEKFKEVDMFDRDAGAFQMGLNLQKKYPDKIKRVKRNSMQYFKFETKYNLIVLRFCCGYLNEDNDLIKFLRKARANLKLFSHYMKDVGDPSWVIVMDNIAEENDIPPILDNQIVRTIKQYEHIFSKAGFSRWEESPQFNIDVQDYKLLDVKAWALCASGNE